ncbi:MAG: RHS repeat-associated core domain-containing protein [Actinomycetota bacterium]
MSFTPTVGTAGTAVTVSGTNFQTEGTQNNVAFNLMRARVNSASATSIDTMVASGATSGRVMVATPAGKAVSSEDFFVPPSPYTAADVLVTSRMAIGESKAVTIGSANKVGLVVFDGAAGQRVSLRMTNVTFGTCGVEVYVFGPDGGALGSDGCVSSSGGGFVEPMTLPAAGTYQILVDPEASFTGSLTLTLYDVPPDPTGTITPDGAAQTVTLSTPGQNGTLSFEGAAGQRVSMKLSNDTIGSGFASTATVAILQPDGSTLVSEPVIPASPPFFDAETLPATGTYRILVDPKDGNTGSLTLTLYDVPADTTGTITPGGAAQTVTLSTPGQNGTLTFAGALDQRVSLKLSNDTIGSGASCTATVKILKPDSSTLASSTCVQPSNLPFFDTRTLAANGTYTILVDPKDAYTGSLTLTLYDVPPDVSGTITIGGPSVSAQVTTPGQNGTLTFAGTSGQAAELALTNVTIGSASSCGSKVSIKKPDGSTLASDTCVTTSGDTLSANLPVTGTYSIFIDPQEARTGEMTLTLSEGGGSLLAFASGPETTSAFATTTAQAPRETRTASAASSPGLKPSLRRARTTPGSHGSAPRSEGHRADDVPARERATAPGKTNAGREEWIPERRNFKGDWRAYREESIIRSLQPLQAEAGVTAVSGQVLRLNGRPLVGAEVAIGKRRAETDDAGQFLLSDVPAGRQVLEINGHTANRPGRTYGLFCVAIDVVEGETNVLSYTIWIPRQDDQHAVTIPSPTTTEVVVTNPRIRGLEVHIPAGTVIRDMHGEPVTEISITPIPIDRPPFPLPVGVQPPVYFTLQPGASTVEGPGISIVYPNTAGWKAGERVDFFSYEPMEKGWFVYGKGTVTPDGKQVVPDPGVTIDRLTCAFIGKLGDVPDWLRKLWDLVDGDPVSLSTGMFVESRTDMALPGPIPITFTRSYRPADSASRPFGIGASHNYELILVGDRTAYSYADLVTAGGAKVHYVRTSAGTGHTDAVMEHTESPTAFYNSVLTWNASRGGWDITLKDGTVLEFFVDWTPEVVVLSGIRDRYGNRLEITRDSTRRITKITSPSGRWLDFSYDVQNRISQIQDNIGRTVDYSYDASGRLWKVTNPAGGIIEYGYDASNRMTTIKDARGITYLTNEYDANDRVTKQTQADGTTYQFAYTLAGNGNVTQTEVTDPRGTIRRVVFNPAGFPTSETLALGQPEAQTYTYERQTGTNLLLAATDPRQRKTEYTYDSKGNITAITRLADTAQAVTTSFTYEPAFNQLASVDPPATPPTSFAYDSKGRLTTITDARGKQTTLTYNPAGQPLTVTNPLSETTTFAYELGDLTAVTNPLGETTSRFVDGGGRFLSASDSLGDTIHLEYGALDTLTKATDPLGNQTSFTYDGNGNVLTVTDARSNTTTYAYDNMDRLESRQDPLLRTETFEYDAKGNATNSTDRRGKVTTFQYDPLNRRTFAGFGTTGTEPNLDYESTITYAYDNGNRLTSAVDSLAGTITRAYDDLDRLTSETTPQGTVSYAWDDDGRRTNMTVSGEPQTSYSYDDASRLTQISKGSSTVAFAYDNANRRTQLTLPNGVTVDYGYDDASHLTALTYKLASTTLGDLAYAYDAAGRRTQVSGTYGRTGLPQAISSATYDAANQLTSWGGATLAFDANGNLTNDGSNTYTWNARNELASIAGGASASFQYDALGRRTRKTLGGLTTDFLYDGANIVQELSAGSPSANLLTGLGVDEVFSRTDSAGTRAFLTDVLGSTIALTDSAGGSQTQYTYEPFGRTTPSGASDGNSFQFTGRENDSSELYHYRARYYAPGLHRFVSEDALGLSTGHPNSYAYVGNDPTNLRDPFGYTGGPPAIVVGAVIGAVSGGVGAASQGGGISDIAVAAIAGAAGGAAFAAFPWGGIPAGAVIGGAFDALAQFVSCALSGRKTSCDINRSAIVGSVVAGGFGAGFGRVIVSQTRPAYGTWQAEVVGGIGTLTPTASIAITGALIGIESGY